MHPETLREEVRQAQADSGLRSDLPSTAEREEIRQLKRENFELRRAKIVRSASVFSAKRPEAPTGSINLTDLDSRKIRSPKGPAQAYNCQAVCTEEQIVLAAELTTSSPDFGLRLLAQRTVGPPRRHRHHDPRAARRID